MLQNGLYSQIIADSTEPLIVVDENCRMLIVSHTFGKLLGYDAEDLAGKNLQQITGGNLNLFLNKSQTASIQFKTNKLLKSDRNDSFIRLNIHLKEFEHQGKTVRVLVVTNLREDKNLADLNKDNIALHEVNKSLQKKIEDQKHLAKNAIFSASRIKNVASEIAKNFPNGFITVLSKESEVLFAKGEALKNPELNQIFKIGNILTKSTCFTEFRKKRIADTISQTLAGAHLSFEIQYITTFFSVSTAPLRDQSDQMVNVLAVYNDISKLKEIELNMQTALQKEQDLNDLKSRFISLASHEFRTPLSAILTSAILIGKKNGDNAELKREKYVAQIERNVHHLTVILNDFLSLSKIDEGKVTPVKDRFDVIDFVLEMVRDTSIVLKKGQEINISTPGNSVEINTDRKFLNHILNNLLSNASKYSGENTVINFKISQEKNEIVFEVSDNGIGIPHEEQKYMFERFFRANNALNTEGTGLGLNIVQHYTKLMGGTIICESEVDQGTTFWVKFPIKPE